MFLGNGLVARNAGQKPRKASKAASRAESLGRGLWPAGKGTLGCKLCLQVALAPGKGAELWCSCRAGHWLRSGESGHASGSNRCRCWLWKLKPLGVVGALHTKIG